MLKSLLNSMFGAPQHATASGGPQSRRLHLGCGRDIRAGWINLDSQRLPGVDLVANLDACRTTPLPLGDNSIDEFLGSHLLEHLMDPLPFMQELYRIAANGAKLVFRLPYGSSDDADADPTHVRRYYETSFKFFSQLPYERADYGYRGDWKTEQIELIVPAARLANKTSEQLFEEVHSLRNIVQEMVVTLRAVKPARSAGGPDTDEFPVVLTPYTGKTGHPGQAGPA